MTWLRKARPALFVIGFSLAIGSLLGARALTAGNGTATAVPKTANPIGTGQASGPVVLGTVDSDPPPIAYGLPPVMQSGTIAKVLVKDGQEVKVGDELYAFDASIQNGDLERARAAVKLAQTKVDEAKKAAEQHAEKVNVMKQGIELAELKSQLMAKEYHLIRNNFYRSYKTNMFPENTWEDRLRDEPTAFEAQAKWNLAEGDVKLKKAELAVFETADLQLLVRQAEAGVEQARAEERKAQTAVDLCVIRAQAAGTIEQVTISPGSTIGISTRTPALWLIPGQKRVVRAEIEADFAHRVGQDLIGKQVTVIDHTDPKLTYKGTVTRVGTTFLPKRSSNEGLLSNDTRVLEAVIEVADPAPAGKPPLRVGQRVRVNLGQ